MKKLNTLLIALTLASASLPVLADAATEAASASATATSPAAAAGSSNSRAAMRERFMQRMEQRRQQNGGATGGARKMPGDTNGDGMISKQEAQSMPRLSSNFDAIDSNKDGELSQEELKAFGQSRAQGMKGNMPMRNQTAAAPASAAAAK